MDKVTVYLNNQTEKYSTIVFVNMANECSELKEFSELWEILNGSDFVIPIVFTHIYDLEFKIREELSKNKKIHITKELVLERINLAIKN